MIGHKLDGANGEVFERWRRGEIESLPAGVRRLTGDRCWLRLANGWTVSISETDTPPALCCLAA
jgi:hypothetical protein